MKRFTILFILLAVILPLAISQTLTVTNGAVINATFVRPANSTAYAANDVVGDTAGVTAGYTTAIPFRLAGIIEGQAFKVEWANLVVDTLNATNGTFSLYLFRDTVTTAVDNGAFAGREASFEGGNYLGKIDYTLAAVGAGGFIATSAVAPNIVGKLKTGKTSIYGILVASAAYTPHNNMQVSIQLHVRYL
jgi:hypothetical protein